MSANDSSKHSAAVFVTDRKYLLGTRVAVRSLLFNSTLPGLTVYIVCDESVGARERQRLAELHPAVRVIATSNTHRRRLHTTAHFSHAMYLKYDLPNVLPADVEKVLFLDSDVIVSGSLRELYDTDLKENFASAVEEQPLTAALAGYIRDDLNLGGPYFNSGVLLLNLRKMRAENLAEKLEQFTRERPWLRLPDQDAFNVMFGGRVIFAGREYNHMAQHQRVPGYPLPPDEVKIIHYAHWRKPWRDADMPLSGAFIQHLTLLEKLALLPRLLVPVLFYKKRPDADGEGIGRHFKFFGLPLYTKWKNETAWETRVLGLRFAGKYGRKA